MPEIASYLGWCTWDAFYDTVSALGIVLGLQTFKRAGVQPRWIVIDDGWQVGLRATLISVCLFVLVCHKFVPRVLYCFGRSMQCPCLVCSAIS